MNLVTIAYANDLSATTSKIATSTGLVNFLPLVAIFLIFYFLLIRPQVKKQKELQSMIASLKKGNKVIAAGGIIGKIIKIEDNLVNLEIDNNTKIQVLKNSITECLNDKAVEKSS